MKFGGKKLKGFTLIESIIAIGLTGILILIFAASNTYISANQYLKHKSLATQLAEEELEALRNVQFAQLSNRTAANFIEVAYNKGVSQVESLTGAPSGANVYELTPSSQSGTTGVTSLSVVPGFDYSDFTVTVRIKVPTGSSWETGLFLRYHDINNYYRVYLTSSNLYFVKKVAGGTETPLQPQPAPSISAPINNFYYLTIIADGNNFKVYYDTTPDLTTPKFTATDSDSPFLSGRIALFGGDSVHAYFDDVSIFTSSTTTWNFDSDTPGKIAKGWQRFGLNDLPGGAAELTISDYTIGSTTYTDLKTIKAKVKWNEKDKEKSVEISTYISKHGLSL